MTHAATVSATRQRSLLAWWHLLSLDAPSVAAIWLVFVTRHSHRRISALLPLEMFVAVWMIYAADRLLEHKDFEPRHRFHQEHWKAFLTVFCVAGVALVGMLSIAPPPGAYLVLSGLMLAWMALVHCLPGRFTLPKEVVTGVIFAAAVFLPLGRSGVGEAAAFAALGTLNGWYIHCWETGSLTNLNTGFTSRLIRWRRPLSVSMLLLLMLGAFFGGQPPVLVAIAIAVALLLALDRNRFSLQPTDLRAAADLALLTPLLVLPFLT